MLLVLTARFFLLRVACFETLDHKEPSIRDCTARKPCKIARQLATCCQALGSSPSRGPSNLQTWPGKVCADRSNQSGEQMKEYFFICYVYIYIYIYIMV